MDSSNVYWSNDDTTSPAVVQVAIGGGTPVTLYSGPQVPESIAIDATSVYWVANFGGPGTVTKVPIGGDGGAATILYSLSGAIPCDIAVDSTSAYWTDCGGASTAGIISVPVGGGSAVTLASGTGQAFYIAIDASNVYWSSQSAGVNAILSVPKVVGGSISTLASGLGNIQDLAVDASFAYYVDSSASAVLRVPIGGGTPSTVATQGGAGIAIDAAHVYRGGYTSGTI